MEYIYNKYYIYLININNKLPNKIKKSNIFLFYKKIKKIYKN